MAKMSGMHGLGTTTPTCSVYQDPSWPKGCPTGYTNQAMYYVPNSEVVNALSTTPGAVLELGANGCPQYVCTNSSGEGPLQNPGTAGCGVFGTGLFPAQAALYAAGALGLLLLPGWGKLLGVGALAGGFLYAWGWQWQLQPNAAGTGTQCVQIGASGL
jgi:hypothetical protein